MFLISLPLLVLVGYLLAACLAPATSEQERSALAFPFGLGMTTLTIWAVLAVKFPISSGILIFLQALQAAGLFYCTRRTFILRRAGIFSLRQVQVGFVAILVFVLFALDVLFNIGFPVGISDGIGYKIHGEMVASEQSLMAFRDALQIVGDQNRTLGFPLISGYFRLFDFNYPQAVQSLFYICLVWFFFVSIRKFIEPRFAGIFTLLLATSPMVWWQSFLYLNNLSAGFYFFCGMLYWLYFLREDRTDYLPLASLGFMFSAWTRYEFLLFFFIPLGLTVHRALKTRQFKAPLLLVFFPLVFAGLWVGYSFLYYPAEKMTTKYLWIFLAIVSTIPVYVFIYKKEIASSILIKTFFLIVGAISVFVFTNIAIQEKLLFILSVFLSKLTWNIFNQSVWGLGILLVFVIPFYYAAFSTPQKYFLVGLLCLYFSVSLVLSVFFGHSSMQGESFLNKLRFFLETPGKIAGRTSSREFFVLFPSLLFFLGISMRPQSVRAKSAEFIDSVLYKRPLINAFSVFIAGNCLLIAILFLWPRVSYLLTHLGDTYEEIQSSVGPRDNRNIFAPTYKIAYAVSKLTPAKAVIILPYPYSALKHEKNPYDSIGVFAAYDVLYPRFLYWEGFENEVVQKAPADQPVYRVTYEGWLDNKCKIHPEGKPLGYHEWYLCPEGEGK